MEAVVRLEEVGRAEAVQLLMLFACQTLTSTDGLPAIRRVVSVLRVSTGDADLQVMPSRPGTSVTEFSPPG